MKILQIKETDCDGCSDSLYPLAMNKFRSGEFTHIESEGFTLELERGTKIENGDSFVIRPTRAAAREFSVDIKNGLSDGPVRLEILGKKIQ